MTEPVGLRATVGCPGLGVMGRPMAGILLAAGFGLAVPGSRQSRRLPGGG